MNLFALISGFTTVTYLLVGAFVLARSTQTALHRVFFVYCLLGAYGAGVEFCYRTAETAERAQFWINFSFGWVFLVAALLHFVLLYTENGAIFRRGLGYLLLYGPASLLMILFAGWDIVVLRPERVDWGWSYVPEVSAGVGLLLAAWPTVLSLFGVYFCLRYLLRQTGHKRVLARHVFLAIAIPGVLSFVSEGILRPAGVAVPELGSAGGLITCLLVGYAMRRHDLFAVTAVSATENILSTMSDLVFLLGPDLRIVLANRAAIRTLGYDEEEVVGELMERFIAADHAGRRSGAPAEVTGLTGASLDVNVVICGKGGRRVPVSLSTSLLTDEEGKIRGSLVVCRDISVRVEAQKALVETEERFSLLVENSPSLAVQGYGPDRRIFFWNDASERIYGYTKEEAVGCYIDELIVPAEDRDAFVMRVRRWLAAQPMPAAEALRIAKNAGQVPVYSSHAKLFNSRGEAELYNLDLDLSERKRLENQFMHAQKMESVGRLAGGIAHDFNNLITIILGNADLAVAMLPPEEPTLDNIKEIAVAAEHAADLTRRLLAFSRRQVAQPRILSLNDELKELESMLGRLVAENITIRLELAFDLWSVEVDPGQLEQILSNLVVNAVDAMPRGGGITIETHNTVIDQDFKDAHPGAALGDFVKISVLDTGAGMSPEVREKVFEPFFTTKERGKGTGLGLATCYGIVKQNRGFIWVSSEPAMGTVFEIFLPRVAGVPDTKPVDSPAAPVERGVETVLLVEDAGKVRAMMADALLDKGYTVLVAENGADALDRLEREPATDIDLLIADVVMPRMGGKELSERIKKRYPGCRVLFISGYTDESIADDGVLAPGVELLEKPFTSAALLRRARRVLDEA